MSDRPWVSHYAEGTRPEIPPIPFRSLADMARQSAGRYASSTAFTQCMAVATIPRLRSNSPQSGSHPVSCPLASSTTAARCSATATGSPAARISGHRKQLLTKSALLCRNIAFVELHDAGANNTVVECIARATPLLVNKLPSVVEYLGAGYPFYYDSLEEAAEKAEEP